MSKKRGNVSLEELHSIGRGESPQNGEAATGSNGASKPAETKAQRFRRLAEDRVQKALDRIMRLVPLGNRAQYEWGPNEVEAIVGALALAVGRVKQALASGAPEKPTFRFYTPADGAAQPQAEASAAQ